LAGIWFYIDGQLDKYIEHVTYVHSLGTIGENNEKLSISKISACDTSSCGMIGKRKQTNKQTNINKQQT